MIVIEKFNYSGKYENLTQQKRPLLLVNIFMFSEPRKCCIQIWFVRYKVAAIFEKKENLPCLLLSGNVDRDPPGSRGGLFLSLPPVYFVFFRDGTWLSSATIGGVYTNRRSPFVCLVSAERITQTHSAGLPYKERGCSCCCGLFQIKFIRKKKAAAAAAPAADTCRVPGNSKKKFFFFFMPTIFKKNTNILSFLGIELLFCVWCV